MKVQDGPTLEVQTTAGKDRHFKFMNMRECMYIDFNSRESCDNKVEGNTNFCATHNSIARKLLKQKEAAKLPRKKPNPQSDKMKERLKEYNARVKVWKVENPQCKAKCNEYCTKDTDDCQHLRGRGKYLMDESTWMPVCRSCHTYIGDHSKEAYEKGWALSRLEVIPKEPHII